MLSLTPKCRQHFLLNIRLLQRLGPLQGAGLEKTFKLTSVTQKRNKVKQL